MSHFYYWHFFTDKLLLEHVGLPYVLDLAVLLVNFFGWMSQGGNSEQGGKNRPQRYLISFAKAKIGQDWPIDKVCIFFVNKMSEGRNYLRVPRSFALKFSIRLSFEDTSSLYLSLWNFQPKYSFAVVKCVQ